MKPDEITPEEWKDLQRAIEYDDYLDDRAKGIPRQEALDCDPVTRNRIEARCKT